MGIAIKTEDIEKCRNAAEQGNADAQFKLGACYENGEGVVQDYGEARDWYWKAAKQGHADAQPKLGVRFEKGKDDSKDWEKSIKWYRRAQDHQRKVSKSSAERLRDAWQLVMDWLYELGWLCCYLAAMAGILFISCCLILGFSEGLKILLKFLLGGYG